MLTNVSWGRVPAALIYSERQLHLSWYLFLTATGKGMQGKCAEVNKDSSKSLHMSHFCVPGWICCEGEARRRYVSRLLNQIRRPHKLSPVRQISQNIDIQVLSLLMIQKRASYSTWMFIFFAIWAAWRIWNLSSYSGAGNEGKAAEYDVLTWQNWSDMKAL